MGAKLAHPDKLCINVWGDAAIGFTGMDFETAVRERIPILSVLLNNFSMAIELTIMPVVDREVPLAPTSAATTPTWPRRSAATASASPSPAEIVPAIKRGIEKTQEGTPALLEFITEKEQAFSLLPEEETSLRARARSCRVCGGARARCRPRGPRSSG